ncbi:MAG: prolipoprotein diacylglyceryl transferase [Candidatus Omnitrophica bacterium]|nr:prolipoprotein diacylglyceryl transferase [Candidatus Omnitrophota bacterium]
MYPIFLVIHGFVIYWYGVMIAIGVYVSFFIFQKLAKKKSYPENTIEKIFFIVVISGVIGGRLLHVLVNPHYYFSHPIEIPDIRKGGLAIQGALMLPFISLIIFLRKNKTINLLVLFDMLAISVPVGQAIGRLADFMNGNCYGLATTGIFAVQFPELTYPVYPTQLFESFANLMIFLVLYLFLYRRPHKNGEVIGWYFILYGALRVGLDFLRGDLVSSSFFGLYATQIFGLIFFIAGAAWIIYLQFLKSNNLQRK